MSPGLTNSILAQIRAMPSGGAYATTSAATRLLESSVVRGPAGLVVEPARACPSYCSGATYLVFVRACQQLFAQGSVTPDDETISALLIRGQRDGEGVWGRWNANGPGTARLFHESGLGRNFSDYAEARPGDFMEIFWTTEVGQKERGHSVIYLGTTIVGGVEQVRFWSSNKPLGYGEKQVPRTQIKQAIFSRFERPENLLRLKSLPARDAYLGSLLTVRSSFAETRARCGF